jgi:hypothetical protein
MSAVTADAGGAREPGDRPRQSRQTKGIGHVGEGDGEHALLVVLADSEAGIRARLADDPWANGMLTIESVKPRSVWLRAKVPVG